MTTPAPGLEPAIEIIGVQKAYGHVPVVRDLDLTIGQGEFFSLLGPSGCGKTTTLRMLAGFEFPDEGDIRLDGRSVRDLPANRRPLNMVFQRYELFPHMSVRRNVGYGLKVAKRPKREIAERVEAMLETVGVGELADRRADQLSGGQQQRVALARALVNNPKALLLDEPLSALDVKLRKRMQLELKAIQQDLGTTFVYVTHDQEEALLMSDRIGIMNHGRLLQVGTPQEIYETPADAFVADFVGQLNSFELEIAHGERVGRRGEARVSATADAGAGTQRFAVRPERVVVGSGGDATAVPGVVGERIYLGPVRHYVVETDLGKVAMQGLPDGRDFEVGEAVVLTWPDDALIHLGGC